MSARGVQVWMARTASAKSALGGFGLKPIAYVRGASGTGAVVFLAHPLVTTSIDSTARTAFARMHTRAGSRAPAPGSFCDADLRIAALSTGSARDCVVFVPSGI